MAVRVVIPKMGMNMEEGTLAEWLVGDSQLVAVGQPIFRMTTDKIDCEVEAEAAGILRHLVPEETTVPAGGVVACILAAGEELPPEFADLAASLTGKRGPEMGTAASTPPAGATSTGEFVRATPAARRLARELGVELARVPTADVRVTENDVRRYAESVATRLKVTPVAQRIAEEHGVNLAAVAGSGPGGRITREDVEQALAAGTLAAAQETVIPFKGVRRTIAERMHQSLLSMAQLTITMEVDMTEAARMLSQLRQEWEPQGIHLTYTDTVVKATATALREHPRLNATLEGEVLRLLPEINVGVAVALDDGLIVPVIPQADARPLKEISRLNRELADKARAGRLTIDEISGGTFTVTSLGMYDVDTFTPIVNPPQAAILGIGCVKETPAFAGEQVVRRHTMNLSLSFDHRLVDGAPAAQFLRRVRDILERPYLLLV